MAIKNCMMEWISELTLSTTVFQCDKGEKFSFGSEKLQTTITK